MTTRALGIYREPAYSPGKVEADAAIMDAVLAELARQGWDCVALSAQAYCAADIARADVVLAMCQGDAALRRLARSEREGAIAINSALAIRNCYRDLLAQGLARSGAPTPRGILIDTSSRLDDGVFGGLDLASGVYVKRGDFHALSPSDVVRVDSREAMLDAVAGFARRGVRRVFAQQEVNGEVVKFYGAGDGAYFAALSDSDEVAPSVLSSLARDAATAARALGLEAWGGDAVLSGGRFTVIDFNDWPSFSRVRESAARAIARRAIALRNRALSSAETIK